MILKMQVSMQELHNVLVIFLSQQELSIVNNTQFFRKRLMLSQTHFLFSAKVFSMALVIFPFPFQSRPSEKKKEKEKKKKGGKREKRKSFAPNFKIPNYLVIS